MTTITVTQEHIDEGLRKNCNRCPLALAINGVLLSDYAVSVNHDAVKLYDAASLRLSVDLPAKASAFVRLFDAGWKSLEPISFPLDIPEQFLKASQEVRLC